MIIIVIVIMIMIMLIIILSVVSCSKIGSYLYLKMLVGSVGGIVTHSPKYYPCKKNQ